jgi:hypothetical protein
MAGIEKQSTGDVVASSADIMQLKLFKNLDPDNGDMYEQLIKKEMSYITASIKLLKKYPHLFSEDGSDVNVIFKYARMIKERTKDAFVRKIIDDHASKIQESNYVPKIKDGKMAFVDKEEEDIKVEENT